MQATMTELTKWERKRLARDAMRGISAMPEFYCRPYWMSGMWFLQSSGEHRRTALCRWEWVIDANNREDRKRWVGSYFEWKATAKSRLSDAMLYKGRTIPLP